MGQPVSWKAAYQRACGLWRNWRLGLYRTQLVKTGGTSFFCLHGDRLVFKSVQASTLQCSSLSKGTMLWRVDISSYAKLRTIQVDPVSERILVLTKNNTVNIHDSNGALHHSMNCDGHLVQSVIKNNILFLLLKFKSSKTCRLDVWDVQHKLVLRSFAPAYRSRFCVSADALIVGEPNALRVWSLPSLQPALSVPTEPVRSHKFMASSGSRVLRVLKLAAEAYEVQVLDAQRQTLEWRLSSTHPIRAMAADAKRLVLAFKEYVRVWDLRTHALLLHLPKEVIQERKESMLPSLKLVDAKLSWSSVFSATCIALQQHRLLVKYPALPHIVVFDFSVMKDSASSSSSQGAAVPDSPVPPSSIPLLPPGDEDNNAEEPSDVTAMTLYGDRLTSRAEIANEALNLDEFL